MNIEEISLHISNFIDEFKQELYMLAQNESKALELAGTIAVGEHYKSLGYTLEIKNPEKRKNAFVVKTSTRGYPWNFSKICISKNSNSYEIHTNLSVKSFHDVGIYCVDIGIICADSIIKDESKWKCVDNEKLISFGEVKKLVVYPMLLAQFIGIVHEIKPYFLIDERIQDDILPPTLISLGNFSGNSQSIVDNYKKRNINVYIAHNFDVRLANYRARRITTPFYSIDLESSIEF